MYPMAWDKLACLTFYESDGNNKEIVMYVLTRRITFLSLSLVCAALVVSCTGVTHFDRPSWTEVQVADVKNVTGLWEGPIWQVPRTTYVGQNARAKVVINEDGVYKFESYSFVGSWIAEGSLIVENGKLVSTPLEKGSIEVTLYEDGGKRMLKADITDKRGFRQMAELRQDKKKGDGY